MCVRVVFFLPAPFVPFAFSFVIFFVKFVAANAHVLLFASRFIPNVCDLRRSIKFHLIWRTVRADSGFEYYFNVFIRNSCFHL